MTFNLLAAHKTALSQYPDLTVRQLIFLQTVDAKPGLSQTEICQELNVTLSAVSRSIDVWGSGPIKTERHKSYGLVKAVRDIEDDRLILIYLTAKGRQFLADINTAGQC
jgi:DNA-binding MarR family transcriptional regulator